MSFSPTKRCPDCRGEFKMHVDCRGEFKMHVEQCPDCATTLIATDGFGGGDPHGPPPPGYALGPEDLPVNTEGLVDLGVSGEPTEMRRVSVALSRQHIRHWLIPVEPDDPLAAYNKPTDYMHVLVRNDDLQGASKVVRRLYWERDGEPEGLDLDAALADSSTCPACATRLPANGADECPECGLGLA